MVRTVALLFPAVLLAAPERVWALANPASVFCAKSGGKSEIRKGPHGQYGVCVGFSMVALWTSWRIFARCACGPARLVIGPACRRSAPNPPGGRAGRQP